MAKEEILGHLRAAKTAHIKWVKKANSLIGGADIPKDAIPVESTECKFGQWFYGEGQLLNALSNNPLECMQKIEKLHFDLHDTYHNIFNIYFAESRKLGFFASFFSSKKKSVTPEEYDLAVDYYNEMKNISNNLIEEIDRLERRLTAVSDEKMQEISIQNS